MRQTIVNDPSIEREALALFEALLDIPEPERDEWIAERTRGRPELLERLDAIRAADRDALVRTGAATDALYEETAPERIGAYRIVTRIGRGGMGSVYRGEREAGDFAHVAAIKIIKPGLLSEALVARFERERQTLAALAHPNIAQLYDGGETEGGSPYIVMEYVDGLPLLEWVETHAPDAATRRRLFRDTCAAVAFAHRNLIVHRDLTPSNVLVTQDGTVKLIDFGIARPADALAAPAPTTGPASIASLSLTPGYAAPERMTSSEVTTAADIYSLGRLLEKLIPSDGDRELRAIVARATAADPLDRYPTAEALSADVDAWGDGFPVAAISGGRAYAARKFVRRHRFGVFASGIAALLLLGAFGLTLRAWHGAEAARAAETMRFNQLRDLANYMLFDLNDRMGRVIGNTEARVDLARRAQTYLAALAASPGIGDDLRLEAAEGFIKLARIQGVPNEPNFGEREDAKKSLDQAEALLRSIGDAPLPAHTARARLFAHRAVIQIHGDNDGKAATASIAAALAALDKVPAGLRDLGWFQARGTVRKAQIEVADMSDDMKAVAAHAADMERELDEWPADARSSHEAKLDRAYAFYYRAYARSFDEATLKSSLPLFREAETRFRDLEGQRPNEPVALYMLAWTGYNGFAAASQIGDTAQSAHFIELAQTMIDRLLAIEPQDNALNTLSSGIREAQSQWLRDQGRFGEAIARQREVIAIHQAVLTPARGANTLGSLAFSQMILGVIARDAGDRDLACSSWKDAEGHFAELERRDELAGFMAGFLPGLRKNLGKCAAGRPVGEFGPMR